ncbi:flavin reductase ActVB [Kitasatospora sp. MAP12-15]|uniref:flavin reductase family protein n=1 Tax=unclassified Kitasatospora TaxID=2633591 RepID=UPI00247557D1|nr:flavin reductase family protein [Kitasatospora sp. MAP12-44]MDH6113666.1 flavin reductase ActVB [Kitasatospora sp. MAP12-44]
MPTLTTEQPTIHTSTVDAQSFRDAMSLLAAPTAIVATRDADGQPWGFTASAVTSVSLDPPLLLVGIARTSSCHQALVSAAEFTVNVLGEQHQDIARRFATHGLDRFAGSGLTSWPGTALPCLPDARVLLRCTVAQVTPAGDHDLLLGAVTGIRIGHPGRSLVWYQRTFHTAG